MPKQNVVHYIHSILDLITHSNDGVSIPKCDISVPKSRSTWKLTDVTCEKCLNSSIYEDNLAITVANRLKYNVEITVQTNT